MFHVEQFSVDKDVLKKLETYEQILKAWQKKINIVSRGTLDDIWERHFLDSLQLIPIIDGICRPKKVSCPKILDVGSGGGFPGMVLAIAAKFDVTCVDTNYKKTLFLEEIARQTCTKVSILNQKDVDVEFTNFDIITSRAYTSLSDLLNLILSKTNNGTGVFLKGKSYLEEIAEAKKTFSFRFETFPSKTNAESAIIVVSDVVK